ncbi:putative ribosome quality control (RQC) complex YloA/Tae2 family protein [Sedimentibacter acidaminivorans]|uniref:Rqc2 homolog RqcH n=1 Tax=Sedimentibacter acidaminivorans TaxID=913099 RepID=A0ABS4GBH7_9FIRM|nr:NFACT RNA binding domain-containing protein [Sedimentibacter acidaminivorans]MBP1924882.1 putative ribosome quality control (RQC) complex YloA/Tae2 family protein [Sedimentibacter acidaminivorans]
MALDGIFLNSIKDDLNDKLIGGRIDKIYQPDKNEIIISVRNGGENYKLLISSVSSCPRIQLTNIVRKNPEQPPMFCMLMRKHLTGSYIREIKQIDFDRIIEITFECKDELQTTIYKSIIIEIMGKHSNIIFAHTNTKIIIDSIKRIAENVSSLRQIYPGLTYNLPPLPSKINPISISKEEFLNTIKAVNDGMYIYDFIFKTFTGMSPFISREICFISNLNESTYIGELSHSDIENIWNSFKAIIDKIKNKEYSFNIYANEELRIYDFYCINLKYLNSYKSKTFDNPSDMLDTYYYEMDNKNKINQKVSNLIKSINTKLERDKKKIEKQRHELLSAEDREKYKIYGELIIANLNSEHEKNKLKVLNYYDPEQKEIIIPLDPKLNLKQNSQKFFKRYNKLKTAEDELHKLISVTKEEITYLENILFSIEECKTISDLDDIYIELINEGFMKKKGKVKKSKEYKPEILTYISSHGHEIMVGKNNLQNDMLTFKVGKKDDYWFHSKNIPGSHVLIRTNGDELSDEEYVEAARIAAYYSKAKNSSSVEIDYTKKSNVKKPANAKPGFVIYETNYSMLVEPNISDIKLKK